MSYIEFLKNLDNKGIEWTFRLTQDFSVTGTLVSYRLGTNGIPHILTIKSPRRGLVEIPWSSILMIETELNDG